MHTLLGYLFVHQNYSFAGHELPVIGALSGEADDHASEDGVSTAYKVLTTFPELRAGPGPSILLWLGFPAYPSVKLHRPGGRHEQQRQKQRDEDDIGGITRWPRSVAVPGELPSAWGCH